MAPVVAFASNDDRATFGFGIGTGINWIAAVPVSTKLDGEGFDIGGLAFAESVGGGGSGLISVSPACTGAVLAGTTSGAGHVISVSPAWTAAPLLCTVLGGGLLIRVAPACTARVMG
jgi:hypothetical protein